MTWAGIPLSFVAAAIVAERACLVSIVLARRTGLVDRPNGYKAHARPTPYLGGAAVIGAILVMVLPRDSVSDRFAAILAGAALLWLIGTIDDRVNLSPVWRLLAEVGVGVIVWSAHLGFTAFGSGALDLGCTVLWIVAIVNAFNLMDNIDGACAVLAAISAAGIGAAAIAGGDLGLAAVSLTVTGACLGFLRHNLAKPARLFLGDGGSMPLGFLIAMLAMALVRSHALGLGELFACGLFAGLPVLDSILVVISRLRRRVNVLTGGVDHITHRLLPKLGTPARVVLVLGAVQAAVVTLAAVADQLGTGALVATGGLAVAVGVVIVFVLESPGWGPAIHPGPAVSGRSDDSPASEPASTPRAPPPRIAPESRTT